MTGNYGNDIPRVLVIDDQYGRVYDGDERNREREGLCARFLLRDVTGDEEDKSPSLKVVEPIADAVFCRAQAPARAVVGDVVENDLDGCLAVVEAGWCVSSGDLPWSMVLLDLCFYTGRVTARSDRECRGVPEGRPEDSSPDGYFGLTLLRAIQNRFPDLPVVILSSMDKGEVSRELSAKGALGFLDRASTESPKMFQQFLWRHGLFPDPAGLIIGYSKPILFALRKSRRCAVTRENILIRGARGSGKGVFAKYIHASSGNPSSPFVSVNLGGANPEMYESVLFGHLKGAFTGATSDRKGAIEQAHGGTLFIDEIAGINDRIQYGLLRVLEDQQVFPMGTETAVGVDVHFVSATNEDVESSASVRGGFRSDLLDRIRKGGTLFLPDLTRRVEDIPFLVKRFVRQSEKQFPGASERDIAEEVFDKLNDYRWPGNVRELEQCILQAVSDFPDVEYMVANHLQLPPESAPLKYSISPDVDEQAEQVEARTDLRDDGLEDMDLDTILDLVSRFSYDGLNRENLTGKLGEIEGVCIGFVARYLRATFEHTLAPVSGKLQITPAIKMATGDTTISTSKAADLIKRLLKNAECASTDKTLGEAFERAVRLRDGKKRKG